MTDVNCLSDEMWKDIPGYEGIYQASTGGRIRTCEGKTTYTKRHGVRHWKQRILRQKSPKAGKSRHDLRVSLWKNGEPKDFLVARIIAMTFVEGFADGLTVNHKDGNFLNNSASNLEWMSLGDNIRDGFKTGLYKNAQTKVRLIDEREAYIDFDSMAEASRYLCRNNGYLSNRLKNQKTTVTAADGEVFRCQLRK